MPGFPHSLQSLCQILTVTALLSFNLAAQTPDKAADLVPDPEPPLITHIVNTSLEPLEVAIWPPKGAAGRPLLLAVHGNGGSGPGEIKIWLEFAKKHNFSIVCPTLASPVHSKYIPDDAPKFEALVDWIQTQLQYDTNNVFMTGFSGGGYATWYLGTRYPRFFKGLYLQSGNFAGERHDLNLRLWKNKPICVVWGSQDLPRILEHNRDCLTYVEKQKLRDFYHEVLPNSGHESHPGQVAAWIMLQAAKP